MGNSASADTQRYLDGYPGEPDNKNLTLNVDFYSNTLKSKPDGDYVEEIHKKWWGKYGPLEAHHGYIQWLFPIREDGLNHYAQRLQLHEAKTIANDPVLQGRIIKSYELMLDFYGMKLTDRTTGTLARGDNWQSRYAHLNRSFHNYLRITRILKCLGEVGLEHFKIHFVQHVLKEIYENRELLNCYESCVKYWVPVLRKEEERLATKQLVEKFEGEKPLPRAQPAKKMWESDSDDEPKYASKAKVSAGQKPAGQQKRTNESDDDSDSEHKDENKEAKKDNEESKKENDEAKKENEDALKEGDQ